MEEGMAEQIKVNIPIEQLKDKVCSCTNALFIPALQLKIIPPIYSPSGQPEYMMLQVGFLCTNCGERIPLRPEVEQDKKIITFPTGREN
jgi:hypothetical protein